MPKADQYLMIQNAGVSPIEGFTILGYSSTRNCDTDGVIGQFGSGAKHAINLCLRNGLPVWVYCGTDRIEYGLEKETVNDGLQDDEVYHVVYRKNNATKYKRAGWVLDFGVLDWDNIGMAIREFVSNAVDRSIRAVDRDGVMDRIKAVEHAKKTGDLTVKIVDDSERRAKSGYTRVYIAVNEEVREYYGQLGKRFLHFSDNPELAKPGLLKRAGRNVEGGKGAVIYREGVWIRELDGEALYDYNFSANEIEIDECRNSSDYSVRAACARKLRHAGEEELAQVIHAQLTGLCTVEANFDEDYMTDFGQLDDTQKERWAKAWESVAGPEAVVCDNTFSKQYAEKKGHEAHAIGSNWMKALRNAGVRSAYEVLSVDEQRGRTRVPTTSHAKRAVDWAWELCELANLVGGREKPEVFCFQQAMTAESMTNGYQNHEGVHIHIDIANDGLNNELKKTALEEVAHWITGANDNSRDFQQFFIDALVALA